MTKTPIFASDAARLWHRIETISDLRSVRPSRWAEDAGCSKNLLGHFKRGSSQRLSTENAQALAKEAKIPTSILTLEMSDEDFEIWADTKRSGGDDGALRDKIKALVDACPDDRLQQMLQAIQGDHLD